MVNIGLKEKNRSDMAQRLNALLANEFVLYTKTLKHHWNVEGPFFGPLHSMFGTQYEELLVYIDGIAERVRSLGFMPYGTLQEFASHASLTEEPGSTKDTNGMIQDLLDGHEMVIRQIRADVDFSADSNDMGTNNFLSDLLEKHEKTAWMLRSHLQR